MQRRLDRIECKVTQYSNAEEEVSPVVEVVTRAGLLLPRLIQIVQNSFNVSGNTAKSIGMNSIDHFYE